MFRPARALKCTFYVQNHTKCWDLVRCTMSSLPKNRDLSYIGHRRIGLRETFVICLSHLRARYCIWKLRRLLGSEFNEYDFLAGVRQAAILMVDAVRLANWSLIRGCCTERGACAIYGLTQSQRNMHYTQLVRFETKHLCQVVPLSVQRLSDQGRTYVYATIVLVGLRDMLDFATVGEQKEMLQQYKEVLQKSKIDVTNAPTHRRIVLCEFLLTLRKELTETGMESDGWLVDSYKVFGIKLVNYSPVTLQYRVIEFLKPACDPQ